MDVERAQRERDVERAEANDPGLQQVDWERQNVGDEEVERLARALPGNTVLRVIDLDFNRDLTSVDALIECLPRSKVVRVRLNRTGVPQEKVKVVNRVLSETVARLAEANDPGLQTVSWYDQNVGDEEAERLARALPGNTVLREINLRGNRDLTSADALIECLPRSNVVTVWLDETGVSEEKKKVVNRVLSETAARLAEANDPGLQQVDWDGQNVGDEEAERLARALPGNTVLRVIDVDNNADLTSVDALIECLPRSKVVTVRLTGTGVPEPEPEPEPEERYIPAHVQDAVASERFAERNAAEAGGGQRNAPRMALAEAADSAVGGPMLAEWEWRQDDGRWASFAPAVADRLEDAFGREEKAVAVDAERYVDLQTMKQCRIDNPNRTRRVRRNVIYLGSLPEAEYSRSQPPPSPSPARPSAGIEEGEPPVPRHTIVLSNSPYDGVYEYMDDRNGKPHWQRSDGSGQHLHWGSLPQDCGDVARPRKWGSQPLFSSENNFWMLAEDDTSLTAAWVSQKPDLSLGDNAFQCALGSDQSPEPISVHVKLAPLRTAFDVGKAGARAEPRWCADEEATECMSCAQTTFTLIARKHHCRYCGWIVCGACLKGADGNDLKLAVDRWVSSKGLHGVTQLQGGDTKEKSVCKSCFIYAPLDVHSRQNPEGGGLQPVDQLINAATAAVEAERAAEDKAVEAERAAEDKVREAEDKVRKAKEEAEASRREAVSAKAKQEKIANAKLLQHDRDQSQRVISANQQLLEKDVAAQPGIILQIESEGEGTYVGFEETYVPWEANKHIIRFHTAKYEVTHSTAVYEDAELTSKCLIGGFTRVLRAGSSIDVYETQQPPSQTPAAPTAPFFAASLRYKDGWITSRGTKLIKRQERAIKLKGRVWSVIATSSDEKPQWELCASHQDDEWIAYPPDVSALLEQLYSPEQPVFRCKLPRVAQFEPEPEPVDGTILVQSEPEPELEPELDHYQAEVNCSGSQQSEWFASNLDTGTGGWSLERVSLRRRMVPVVDNILINQDALPTYWRGNTEFERVDAPERVADLQEKMMASVHPGTAHGMGNLRVHRVERIENKVLWRDYQRKCEVMRARRPTTPGHECLLDRPAVRQWLGGDGLQQYPRVIEDKDENELWLWHGTKPETSGILAESGFDERQASMSGLYGAGNYFADNSSKSHQYRGHPDASACFCMLYCRVAMGSPYLTTAMHQTDRRPPLNPARQGQVFDSIFAETGVANSGTQLHNEYIVFSSAQVYPEFIVWYTV